MRFQKWLVLRQTESPAMFAQATETNHSLEIATPAVGTVSDDQPPMDWELGENAGQDTVAEHKQCATTFACAITAIEKHINLLQRLDHFSSVINSELCFYTARQERLLCSPFRFESFVDVTKHDAVCVRLDQINWHDNITAAARVKGNFMQQDATPIRSAAPRT